MIGFTAVRQALVDMVTAENITDLTVSYAFPHQGLAERHVWLGDTEFEFELAALGRPTKLVEPWSQQVVVQTLFDRSSATQLTADQACESIATTIVNLVRADPQVGLTLPSTGLLRVDVVPISGSYQGGKLEGVEGYGARMEIGLEVRAVPQ